MIICILLLLSLSNNIHTYIHICIRIDNLISGVLLIMKDKKGRTGGKASLFQIV